jgi:hypothetical protein
MSDRDYSNDCNYGNNCKSGCIYCGRFEENVSNGKGFPSTEVVQYCEFHSIKVYPNIN